MDRESIRQLAFAQIYGSPYMTQNGKDRHPFRTISQRSHSPQCYGGSSRSMGSCTPCVSMSPPHGTVVPEQPIMTYPSLLRADAAPIPTNTPSGCWYDQSSSWSNPEYMAWKTCQQGYKLNVTEGMVFRVSIFFSIWASRVHKFSQGIILEIWIVRISGVSIFFIYTDA